MARDEEVELALAVTAPDPRAVMRRLGALREAGGHRLRPAGRVVLRDIYLDRPDAALRRRGLALRLRRVGRAWWLTLKGPATGRGHLRRRLEIERRWSTAALRAVRAHLPPGALPPGAAVAGRRPRATLKALGLAVLQERETSRRLREVLDPAGRARAEMALDSTRFSAGRRRARHHVVEVEARGPGGRAACLAVARDLRRRFPGALRPWPHGKLATGIALEQLLAAEAAHRLLGRDGGLLPGAYAQLARRLRGRPRSSRDAESAQP